MTKISHKDFEVEFPAGWEVVITDYYSDRNLFPEVFEFELNAPGSNSLTFSASVWSMPVPPSFLMTNKTQIWKAIIGKAQIDSFAYWGGYEGEGLHLSGIPFEHLGKKYSDGYEEKNVRIFSGTSDSCTFIVEERWYRVKNTDITSFRQIEDSFTLKSNMTPTRE